MPDLIGGIIGVLCVLVLMVLWKYCPHLENGNIERETRMKNKFSKIPIHWDIIHDGTRRAFCMDLSLDLSEYGKTLGISSNPIKMQASFAGTRTVFIRLKMPKRLRKTFCGGRFLNAPKKHAGRCSNIKNSGFGDVCSCSGTYLELVEGSFHMLPSGNV